MKALLQISDPHFGTAQPPVKLALHRLVRAQRPEALVLSGDITQRATPEQFAEARAFCDSLQIPRMLTLPGNHDIALYNVFERLFNPYGEYLRAFGPEVETVMESPYWLVIGVNTTRRLRHKNGEVSGAQVKRVASQLAAASPGQLRVVVVHQPVHVLKAEDEHDRLRGWERAVRGWAESGADIIMGGHIHLPYVCELSALVPGLARRVWCVQAGTALSSRTRQGIPNSVNLLRYAEPDATGAPGECCVERWDYQARVSEFELGKSTELQLDRRAN